MARPSALARRTEAAETYAAALTNTPLCCADHRADAARYGATFHLALHDVGIDLTDRDQAATVLAVLGTVAQLADNAADGDHVVALYSAILVAAGEFDHKPPPVVGL
jgi:hypothetical protein